MLTRVGVDVENFFDVGARVLKRGAGVESESENVTLLISGLHSEEQTRWG